MPRHNKQLHRLIRFVAELKRDTRPNAKRFSDTLRRADLAENEDLCVCTKTVQRDIEYLRDRLGAPVEFDAHARGYFLLDPEWQFPFLQLHGDELFAAMFSERLSQDLLPDALRCSLESAMDVQLAAGDPEGVPIELLNCVMQATGARAVPGAETFDSVIDAWKSRRRLRLRYVRSSDDEGTVREVDPHALFLSNGAWYARVHCHLRNDIRSLALHRCCGCTVLDTRFSRSDAIVAQLRRGNVFDFEEVRDVVVHCTPDKSGIIREREWFPGQRMDETEDGGLVLRYDSVSRPELVWWVLSYAGHLEVRSPQDLRAEIRAAAQRIVQRHEGRA